MYLDIANRTPRTSPGPRPELTGELFAALINLAGRRRFTSQRVVLYAVLAAGTHPQAADTANEALALFRDAHLKLTHASDGLPGVFSEALQEAYFGPARGNEKIMAFVSLAERTLFAITSGWHRQTPVLLDELVQCSSDLLAVLNTLTAIYEQEARTHANAMERKLHSAINEITSISKQAQVVAMNARIAAARAGSAGNEFAVVATELISITTEISAILQTAMTKPTHH